MRAKKVYNTTDLQPFAAVERNIVHRDQLAHIYRWSFVLNHTRIGEKVVDFGCGSGNLLELFYRNRFKCKKYIGLDIRAKTIATAKEKFKIVPWANWLVEDLIHPKSDLWDFQADKVVSFEVMEHVGKQNADIFLKNFRDCGKKTAKFFLSTPNYDPQVGAAGNHTYDSGDGRGVDVQEFSHAELTKHISKYFNIEKKYGTFASYKDYRSLMNPWQKEMHKKLSEFYDSTVVSNIMGPFFPEQSRNTLWILTKK